MIDLGISGFDSAEEIGRGESARVYKAREIQLERTVAIKVMSTIVDDDALRRFERERKAMGRLSGHDGIVTIYSTGTTSSGSPYIVMPYFAQGSVQDVVDRGALGWEDAVALMSQAGTAMASAHTAGVVHRNLKPSNMLMSDAGVPKIADFGISRLMDDAAASRSTSLTFTPAFSPPEAFSNSKPNFASDVYGLGATLWSLLTGYPPFTDPKSSGTDLLQLMGRVANEPITRPDGIPDQLSAVLQRSMAKNSAERYEDASLFVAALAAVQSSVASGTPMPAAITTVTVIDAATGAAPAAATPKPNKPSRKNKARVLVMAGALLALLGGGAYAMTQGGETADDLAATVTIPTTDADGNTLVTARPQYRDDGTEIEVGDDDYIEPELVIQDEVAGATGVTVMGNSVSKKVPTTKGTTTRVSPTTAASESKDETTTTKETTPAPVISGLSVGSVTETTASVTFSTNTCVAAKYSYSGGSHASNPGTCYKSHEAKLGVWNAALTPDKSYTVTVRVTDDDGRTATKQISFKTDAQKVAPVKLAISGLSVSSVTSTSATVSFTTNLCATGSYSYSGGSHSGKSGACYTSHQAQLGIWNAALTPGTTYTVNVTSTAEGQTVNKSISFTTTAPANLAISGLSVSSVTSTSATVSFTTNLCSTGRYDYVGGSHSGKAGACYNSHQAQLGIWNAALTPNTTYSVTVTSTADGQTVSKTISFKTLP